MLYNFLRHASSVVDFGVSLNFVRSNIENAAGRSDAKTRRSVAFFTFLRSVNEGANAPPTEMTDILFKIRKRQILDADVSRKRKKKIVQCSARPQLGAPPVGGKSASQGIP